MPTVTILSGPPGTGKSTWARQYCKDNPDTVRVNKDDFRRMLSQGYSKELEAATIKMEEQAAVTALKAGFNVIVDNTHLSKWHIDRITKLVKDDTSAITIKEFGRELTLEQLYERNASRPDAEKVPVDAIEKMFWQQKNRKQLAIDMELFAPPVFEPVPPYNPALPDAVYIDIDGTLAWHTDENGKPTRNVYDASTCETDRVNPNVAELARYHWAQGRVIVILSGRYEKYRMQTIGWLNTNDIPWDMLLMRPDNDSRKDWIVKPMLYDKYIRGKLNILYGIDDRKRVVESMRSMGLTVWAVAPGNF